MWMKCLYVMGYSVQYKERTDEAALDATIER